MESKDIHQHTSSLRGTNLRAVILRFVDSVEKQDLTLQEVNSMYDELLNFGEKHPDMTQLGYSRIYEYRGLILDALGHRDEAIESIQIAAESLPEGHALISDWAVNLLNYAHFIQNHENTEEYPASSTPRNSRTPFYKRKATYAAAFIIILFIWQPVADWSAVEFATPAQKSLADSLNLTIEGRKALLKSHPETVDASTFSQSCQADKSGNLEEGCYIPPSNKIYVRSMPTELKSEEIVTAAHEMLHAAYISLSDSERTHVNSMVEKEFAELNSDKLNKIIASYKDIEPGQKDNELHSFLGSEYDGLDADLTAYYSKYFTNRQVEINAAAHIDFVFNDYSTQLDNLSGAINAENDTADNYYKSSVRGAYSGNSYYNNYYYNLYTDEYNKTTSDIETYNSLLDKYKILVDEYNGKQYGSVSQPVKNTN